MNDFCVWMVGYHHFFSHQNLFIQKFLSLVLYKFDFLVLKFKSPLLKPKLNLLDFFKILQHLYKSFNKNFLNQHDIKMTLYKYV